MKTALVAIVLGLFVSATSVVANEETAPAQPAANPATTDETLTTAPETAPAPEKVAKHHKKHKKAKHPKTQTAPTEQQ